MIQIPISSRYIHQINQTEIFMFVIYFEFCLSCQETHPFSQIGTGIRTLSACDWDYTVLYESIEE